MHWNDRSRYPMHCPTELGFALRSLSVNVVLKLFPHIGGSTTTRWRKPCVRTKHHINGKSVMCLPILRDGSSSSRRQVMYRRRIVRQGDMAPLRLIRVFQMQCVLLCIVGGLNKEPRCNRYAIASATLCASRAPLAATVRQHELPAKS